MSEKQAPWMTVGRTVRQRSETWTIIEVDATARLRTPDRGGSTTARCTFEELQREWEPAITPEEHASAIRAAVEEEREACARIAEAYDGGAEGDYDGSAFVNLIAAAIRGRGKP